MQGYCQVQRAARSLVAWGGRLSAGAWRAAGEGAGRLGGGVPAPGPALRLAAPEGFLRGGGLGGGSPGGAMAAPGPPGPALGQAGARPDIYITCLRAVRTGPESALLSLSLSLSLSRTGGASPGVSPLSRASPRGGCAAGPAVARRPRPPPRPPRHAIVPLSHPAVRPARPSPGRPCPGAAGAARTACRRAAPRACS